MKENEQSNNIFEEETCITNIGLSNLKSAAFFQNTETIFEVTVHVLRVI